MIREKSLKRNAFFNVLKTFMAIVFPLITFPYASRILLPEGLGKVTFANSIISYFAMIASLGIASYGIREGAKRRNDKKAFSQFFAEIFTINMISTLISYFLLFLSINFIPKFYDYKLLLIVCSSSILFTTIGVDWMLSSLEEYGFIALRSIVFQIISLILLFLLVRAKDDYIKYALISVISNVGANVCNLFHLRKFISFKNLCKLQIKQHLKPVFIFFGTSIAISVFTMLDTVMLGFLSTDAEVGYYSAAIKIVHIIRDLFPAIFTVMYPRMSIMQSNSETEKFKNLISSTLCLIMGLSFPIISGLFILAKPILLILAGNSYIPAISTMYSIIPMIFLSATSGFLGGNVLNSTGKEKIYLLCVITGAVTDFVLNLLLIPKYASLGAGIATFFTEFSLFVLYIVLNRNFVFSKKTIKSFFNYALSTLIMTTICWPVSKLFDTPILKLIITTICGIIAYFIILLILKDNLFKTLLTSIKRK